GSAKLDGSDWDIIETILRPVFGHRLYSRVPKANPRQRVRTNATNTRLQTADGTVGMCVSHLCREVRNDYEGVQADNAGEIIQPKGSMRTHISDAIGYYVNVEHPLGK